MDFRALEVLKKAGFFFNQGYKIKIFGDIPINAGISSSSAFVVAWIRFLIATQDHKNKITDEQIGRWAYEAESQFFNEPGGLMDQYTIAQRGLLYIDTKTTQTERLNPDIGTLVIAESGIAKKTLSVLENARAYGQASISAVKKKFPEFDIYKANELDYKKDTNFLIKRNDDVLRFIIPNLFLPLIKSIEPLSPASRAGLLPGDFILSVNGISIFSFEVFSLFPHVGPMAVWVSCWGHSLAGFIAIDGRWIRCNQAVLPRGLQRGTGD